MKKRQLLPVITALLMSLTACSQSQLTRFQQQLSDITSQSAPGAQPSVSKEADRHDVVSVYTLPAGTGVDNLAQLQNERDELLIASWGDIPNWQVIFDLVNPSPAMYEYKEKWVREKGLHAAGMYNCNTNQGAFSVGFTTT